MEVLKSNIGTRIAWGGISYFRQASRADGETYWEISTSIGKENCIVANIRSDAAEISLWKVKLNFLLMFYKNVFMEELKIRKEEVF